MTRHYLLRAVWAALIGALGLTPAIAAPQPQSSAAPRSIDTVRFRFAADAAVRGGFAWLGGRLLFGTESGSVYALDSRSGAPLWRTSVGSGVASVPAVTGSLVYVTSWNNALHALDLRTGRQRWQQNLGANVGTANYWDYYSSSPTIAGGTLYVGSGDGRLYAIDPRSGHVAWSHAAGSRIRTTPAVSGSTIVFGTLSGHVIALDRASGRQLWDFATQGAGQPFALNSNDSQSVVTAPVIQDGLVIAGGRDGNIYGIDLASGAERWRETHDGSSWILGLAAEPGRFYAGSGSALVVQAAEVATGKEIWRTATGAAMFGGVVEAGGVIVGNGMNGTLFAFDARAGNELWRYRLADMTLSTPLVADGAVFTAGDDGSVHAINAGSAPPPTFRRLIYSYTNQPEAGFFWLTRSALGAVQAAFTASGYSPIGNDELVAALRDSGKQPTILVIADTRLPDGVDGAALRHFLNSGGTLVMIGPNPLDYTFDAKTGAPETVDDQRGAAAIGMQAIERESDYGYNVAQFTCAAGRLGLSGQLVANGAASPQQVSLVLAQDRMGMASAWAKQYDNGGLILKLPVPRIRPFDLSVYLNAINLAAAASATGSLAAWR